MPESDKHRDLYHASRAGEDTRVGELLEDGVEPDKYKDDDGYTALQRAAERGSHEIVSRLIKARADLNIQSNFGNTALHWAVFYGHNNVTSTLLEAGADFKIQNNDGKTVLHWAADRGNEGFVSKLLEAGADPLLQDKEGKTPIQVAKTERIARLE